MRNKYGGQAIFRIDTRAYIILKKTGVLPDKINHQQHPIYKTS